MRNKNGNNYSRLWRMGNICNWKRSNNYKMYDSSEWGAFGDSGDEIEVKFCPFCGYSNDRIRMRIKEAKEEYT